MKRFFRTLIAAFCFAAVACTDYQVDIDSLNDRIDSLEKTQIANITQQINAINESLPLLQNADAELKGLIESLNKMAEQYSSAIAQNEEQLTKFKAEIEKSIETLRAEIETSQDEDKQAMLDALNVAKAEIEAQIAALQTDTNGKLDQMNTALAALQAKDKSIGARIDSLKLFVEVELTSTKDWATKTFATLAQQQAIQDDISAIRGNITSLQNSLTALETRLTENYTKAIQNAVSQLEGELSATAAQILKDYTAAIKTAKDEITAAYEQKLSEELDALEEDLTGWVNETLKSYAKIADMQTAISTLKGELEGELKTQSGYITALQNALGDTSALNGTIAELIKANQDAISTNQKSIEDLKSALETAKTDMQTNYEAAISDAVKEGGVVDDLIAKRIDEYDEELTKTIDGINTEISGLKTRVSNLETNMGTLRDSVVTLTGKLNAFISDRIQSISYIPGTEDGEYMSGMVDYDDYGYFTLAFQVRPAKNAAKITDLKQISAKKVAYNTYSGGYSTQLFDNVTVNNFVVIGDVLYVRFKASDVFYNNTMSSHYDYRRVALSVSVKDNSNEYFDVASEYVYLNSEHYFMNYTSSYSVFNPYKFKLNNGSYSYSTIAHLGCNFVDVDSRTTTLSLQFAESTDNAKPNEIIKTLDFGYVGEKGKMYNVHGVQLETGELAFYNCTKLESVDFGYGLQTDNVKSFASMFSNCWNLKKVGMNKLHTSKVENMASMFANCYALDTLDLRCFDTRNLNVVTNMFINCTNLKKLDLRDWDVRKVTNFQGMFAYSPKLEVVDITDWKLPTGTVETCHGMFRNTGIKKVNCTLPAASSLTVKATDVMFMECDSLKTVTLSGNIKGNQNFSAMFQSCTALTEATLKGWTTGTDANLSGMFLGCTALKSVDLSGWTVGTKVNLASMFDGCKNLETLNLSGWKISEGSTITSMLLGCKNLKKLILLNSDSKTRELILDAIDGIDPGKTLKVELEWSKN
jgi:surface protein